MPLLFTPLQYATRNSHLDAVILLLDRGATVCAIEDDWGYHPTISAIKSNNYDITGLLLDILAPIDDYVINMLFMEAAMHCSTDVFQLLIDYGADINYRLETTDTYHDLKETPLICANSVDAYKLLVEMGANEDPFPDTDFTPLMAAIDGGAHDMLSYLISIGKNINTRSNTFDYEAKGLLRAVELDDMESARILLDADVNINTIYYYEGEWYTALSLAVRDSHDSLARLLIDRGADVNMRYMDPIGITPLILAAQWDNMSIAQSLIDVGADTDLTYDNYRWRIHISDGEVIAIKSKSIDHDASPSVIDKKLIMILSSI